MFLEISEQIESVGILFCLLFEVGEGYEVGAVPAVEQQGIGGIAVTAQGYLRFCFLGDYGIYRRAYGGISEDIS